MGAAVALLAALLAPQAPAASPAPLPEGNAFMAGLAQRQRTWEQALDDYAYDVLEVEEHLDKGGAVKRRETREYQVFHARGRPVRRLVAEDGRPLPPDRQAKEDRRIREQLGSPRRRGGLGVVVKVSALLESYDFRSVAREEVDGRAAVVLDFGPRPGRSPEGADRVLRALSGRLWVDEAEREILRAEIRNVAPIRFGLRASVATLDLRMEFHKVDDAVWLPRRVETLAAGRVLLVKGFRVRSTTTYGRFRRFQVESEEAIRPPAPDR